MRGVSRLRPHHVRESRVVSLDILLSFLYIQLTAGKNPDQEDVAGEGSIHSGLRIREDGGVTPPIMHGI